MRGLVLVVALAGCGSVTSTTRPPPDAARARDGGPLDGAVYGACGSVYNQCGPDAQQGGVCVDRVCRQRCQLLTDPRGRCAFGGTVVETVVDGFDDCYCE